MKLVNGLLFVKTKSFLNLFLILPILIFISIGCSQPDPVSGWICSTSDGANLVFTGEKLKIIKLLDGSNVNTDDNKYSGVMCVQNNEIVAIKVESVKENNNYVTERTAVWQNSSKSHRLKRDEFLEKYYGIVQNKYVLSSSRGFQRKSRSEGSGNSRKTILYNFYDQPQVYNLEDFNTGEVKSQILTLDKLKMNNGGFALDSLKFYTLATDESGNVVFAVINSQKLAYSIYRLNVLSGDLTTLLSETKVPERTSFDYVVSDKAAKYVCLIFDGRTEKGGSSRFIRVLSLENNREVFSKTFEDISFNGVGTYPLFLENSNRLAILINGFKFEPTRQIFDLIVFDLQNGSEISKIDVKELFDDPYNSRLAWGKGDELVLTYTYKGTTLWNSDETHLCKINILSRKVVWDAKL
ncbi:MAG: hypothetical protein K1X72_22400 [Pyrinomonadaceae bacterium]|nr:hypothetical protein [Pyrinomonadaceae bacterium]